MVAFTRLASALDGNPALQRRARLAALAFTVRSGDDAATVEVGERVVVRPGAASGAAFSLAAAPGSWAEFATAGAGGRLPEPRGHAARRPSAGRRRHAGLWPQHAVPRAALRRAASAARRRPLAAVGAPVLEPVVGRYLRLDFNGRPHRIYFEEAGQGIPLLCLHTAGADGRQYRAILNDAEITARYRVIAFDLPWHGKSSPPPGFETEAYQLTTDLYVDTVMAVSRALRLERPVVMGCSIGGRAVLHLALRHGAALPRGDRPAVGDACRCRRRHPPARSRRAVPSRRARPGGRRGHGRLPDRRRRRRTPTSGRRCGTTCRAGPSVFLGDLHYYFADGDLRNADLDGLDAKACPLYLLTGEYDLSATPELTAELARLTRARHFEVMKGMGHFPMSEKPAAVPALPAAGARSHRRRRARVRAPRAPGRRGRS